MSEIDDSIRDAVASLQAAADEIKLFISENMNALALREAKMSEITGPADQLGRIESDIAFIRNQLMQLQKSVQQLAVAAERAANLALSTAASLSSKVTDTASQATKDTAKIAANLELSRQHRETFTPALTVDQLSEPPVDPLATAEELEKQRKPERKNEK